MIRARLPDRGERKLWPQPDPAQGPEAGGLRPPARNGWRGKTSRSASEGRSVRATIEEPVRCYGAGSVLAGPKPSVGTGGVSTVGSGACRTPAAVEAAAPRQNLMKAGLKEERAFALAFNQRGPVE